MQCNEATPDNKLNCGRSERERENCLVGIPMISGARFRTIDRSIGYFFLLPVLSSANSLAIWDVLPRNYPTSFVFLVVQFGLNHFWGKVHLRKLRCSSTYCIVSHPRPTIVISSYNHFRYNTLFIVHCSWQLTIRLRRSPLRLYIFRILVNIRATVQPFHYNPIISGLQSSHCKPVICGLQSSHYNPIVC